MIETDISTLTDRFVYEAYDAATHLIGGLLGEGHSEDPCRVDALSDEMDKAARQGGWSCAAVAAEPAAGAAGLGRAAAKRRQAWPFSSDGREHGGRPDDNAQRAPCCWH
jgi:hypothetical protein